MIDLLADAYVVSLAELLLYLIIGLEIGVLISALRWRK